MGGCATRLEGRGGAGTAEHAVATVPLEPARKVRADGRDGCDCAAGAEQVRADPARRNSLALALAEICQRSDVHPAPGDGVDLARAESLRSRNRLERPPGQTAPDSPPRAPQA